MGVQVSLEFAANFPERVGGLVLLNGTYGQVMSTGFQPLVSIPFLPKRLHAAFEAELLEFLRSRHGSLLATVRQDPKSDVPAGLGEAIDSFKATFQRSAEAGHVVDPATVDAEALGDAESNKTLATE